MNQREGQGRPLSLAKLAIAVAVGLVALVLLFPASGVDTLPPECFSVASYSVPCGGGVAFAVATLYHPLPRAVRGLGARCRSWSLRVRPVA